MESAKPVNRNTILSYGGLATPLAMIGYPIAIWLIPFYSEVVGIELYVIANILLLARFTDVITDPILGQLGDSTKTSIGRRKPWIILGVPLMMFAIYKLFIPGAEVSVMYFIVWMMLMYLGSTIIGIPYGAWGAEISPDYHQRSRIVSGREGWTLIGLLISALIPLSIEVSGSGQSIGESLNKMLRAVFFFEDFSTTGKMRDILAYMGMGIILLLPMFTSMRFLQYFLSHYLNKVTPSKQRATVLSFKGLSMNLSFGILTQVFGVLTAQLYLTGRFDRMVDPELAAFRYCLKGWPIYFVFGCVTLHAFIRLKHRKSLTELINKNTI